MEYVPENEILEEEELERIDFGRYFRLFYKRKWLMLAIFLSIIGLSGIGLFFWSPQPSYRAEVTLRVDEGIDQSRFAIINSRSFAEVVVGELALNVELESADHTRDDIFAFLSTTRNSVPGNYLIVFSEDGYQLVFNNDVFLASGPANDIELNIKEANGFSFRINPGLDTETEEVRFQVESFRSAVESLRKRIGFYPHPYMKNLLVLSLEGNDPQLITETVNAVAEMFVSRNLELIREQLKRRRKLLGEKLEVARVNKDNAEEELALFKSQSNVEGSDAGLGSDIRKNLYKLGLQKDKLSNEKNEIKAILDEIGEESESFTQAADLISKYRQLASYSTLIQDAVIGRMGSQLLDLAEQRDKLSLKLQEKHPDLVALDSQMKEIQERIKEAIEHHFKSIDATLEQLSEEIAQLKKTLKKLPEEERTLTNLASQARVKTEIYRDLLVRYQEAQIAEQVESGDMHILDTAIIPSEPLQKNPKMYVLLIATFLGLMFAFFVVLAADYFDNSIRTVYEIKKHLRLPTIGIIPKSDISELGNFYNPEENKTPDSALFSSNYPLTPVAEAYSSLRTNIAFSEELKDCKSIVFTSVAPNDGKSFTAANLAITMARHRTKTLLVDADLRRGVLHNTFNCSKGLGLTDLLLGNAFAEDIINLTDIPDLRMVSCGDFVPNPTELLSSRKMKKFLEYAQMRYNVIILDSPPLNAATDAMVLAPLVDGLVLVVKSEVTNFKEAKTVLELFNNLPVRIMGVVLNAVQDMDTSGYYGYYAYHNQR